MFVICSDSKEILYSHCAVSGQVHLKPEGAPLCIQQYFLDLLHAEHVHDARCVIFLSAGHELSKHFSSLQVKHLWTPSYTVVLVVEYLLLKYILLFE